MSLRSLRDTLLSFTGSSPVDDHLPMDVNVDLESVWSTEGHSRAWSRWIPGSRLLGYGSGYSHHHHIHGTDWRSVFFWLAAFALVLLFAVITNPSESSFRAHLTELSFRRHLADIRRSETDEPISLSDEQAQLPSSASSLTPATPDRRGSIPVLEPSTHTVAPFRFANHVAISLRTPTLLYRSLFVCAITITSPIAPPAFLSDPSPSLSSKGKHAHSTVKERHVIWIGCMGHWILVGFVPQTVEWAWQVCTRSERDKGRKKNSSLDKAGVIDMRAVQNKEEPSSNTKPSLGHSLNTPKHMRRTDSSTNLVDAPTQHALIAPNPSNSLNAPESRRPSLVNLIASPTATLSVDSPEIASSPVITALKADLAAAQSVLTELQGQLSSHEQAVHDAHAYLQTNLDELRSRRKEDDAERQELKSRTKSFEEQKRQAEAARRDAEKKLKAVEGVRDGLQGKISAAELEIRDLRENMSNSEKNVRIIQEEGAKYVVHTQEVVDEKKKELEGIEAEVEELEGRNEELLGLIQEAEDRRKAIVEAGEAARKIGPEEEMMMMAAAYEAAAQEGYSHGGYQHAHGAGAGPGAGNGAGSGGQRQDQWASQAAAYMAEAGMPHLGYDYTARPAHSNTTGFGHLSKHPNSASSRDLAELKRNSDFTGFEDFGPGAAGAPTAANLVLGPVTRRSLTPLEPPSDSESDIYGHDPGSPNGGISSSFSANLLPQGLFRSLEGDQTPLVSGDEDLPITFGEPLEFELDEPSPEDHADDSGSDSGDEDVWRSPLNNEPRLSNPGLREPSRPLSGGNYGRLLSPPHGYPSPTSATVNNTTPPAIPGLPALPTSRRWFSGTASSDNIPSTFGGFMHSTTSNDSLNLGPGYESSPFAPTSSEKKALAAKWAPFGKRWTGNNDESTPSGWPGSNSIAIPNPKSASSSALPNLGTSPNGNVSGEEEKGEKKPFRFFSLRKPPSMTGSGSTPP